MGISERDGVEALTEAIGRYNDAWNSQDLDAIMAMHAPDMVFANHTAGESAEGEAVRGHIAKIFEAWPDMEFETRRLYVREGLVVQEWTATATTPTRCADRGPPTAQGRRLDPFRPDQGKDARSAGTGSTRSPSRTG